MKQHVLITCFTFILLFLFSGCSSTLLVPQQEDYNRKLSQINYLGKAYVSEIILLNGSSYEGYDLNVSQDSISFSDYENDSIYIIPTAELNRIVIKDQVASFFTSIWIGLGSVIIVGTAAYLITEPNAGHPNMSPMVGVLAFPLGVAGGLIFSGEREFIFNQTE